MPLPTPDFERLFAPGTRHMLPRGDVATVRLREETSLWLPSGRVVAGEPSGFGPDDGGFVQRVPPGRYPVVLVIAEFAARGYLHEYEMIAAAQLVIRAEPVVSWEMAVCEGQDTSELRDNEFYGYPVDGGTGGFADPTNIARLREDDDYDDRLMAVLELGETDFASGTLTDGEGRPLLAVFSSGSGDGYYPTWVGRSAAGEVARFLTDFFVLKDEPHSGEGAGTPTTPQGPADATETRPLTALSRPLTPGKPLSPGRPLSQNARTPARTVTKRPR